MSIEKTVSIKGVFVLLVFLSHFVQYVELNSFLDQGYFAVRDFLGQLIVTMFLFYSGYGILESIKRKKIDYINSIPKKRIFMLLFDFDLAILLFLLVKYLLGSVYQPKTILLSLIGWSSVGNSNWYIFAILITYLITYVAFKIFSEDYFKGILTVSLLSVLYIAIIQNFKPLYSYNTILCYAGGMWYSFYREKIELMVQKSRVRYLLSLLVLFVIFMSTYLFANYVVNYQIKSLAFVLLIVLASMKLSINNKVLNWAGSHVFSIYILQRIPMMILKEVEMVSQKTYVYLMLSAVFTVFLSYGFDWLTDRLYKKIF